MNQVLHRVPISGEGGDEGPNELLADRRIPLHQEARNLKHHVVRIVRHDAVFIRALPRGVVLVDEGFDIGDGWEYSGSRHATSISQCLVAGWRPRRAAFVTRSASDWAFILRIT